MFYTKVLSNFNKLSRMKSIYRKLFIFSCFLFFLVVYHILVWGNFPRSTTFDISQFEIKKINSILPESTDSNDLNFLIPILKDKRIVLLGESTHFDESTFAAKTRLIKYLHEKLGFSLILFESGRFELEYNFKEIDSPVFFKKTVWDFWADSPTFDKLLSIVQKTQNSFQPLKLSGFDFQPSGNISVDERISIIDSYLTEKHSSLNNFPQMKQMIRNLYNVVFWKLLSSEEIETMNIEIKKLIDITLSMPNNEYDTVFLNYFKSFPYYMRFQKLEWGSNKRLQLRDSLMAEYFYDIHENQHLNKKTIVWISNLHALNDNTQYLENSTLLNFKTFGEYLKTKYKDNIYTICFTSYCNMDKDKRIMNKSTKSTLEYQLHKLKFDYSFIDFGLPISMPFKTRINQNLILDANWMKMCDGIFFIDSIMQNNYEYH